MSAATVPLRAGVVGLGWAGQQHMKGYAACADTDLVAICGFEDDVASTLGERFDVGQTYRSIDDLLTNAELDVVSIATPTALHAPMAIRALDAGVHVLSEKPIAESAERAREMVAAAERNGRVLDVSFNHRRRGVVAALKAALDEGLLGDVYYAKVGWVRRRGIPGLGSWFTRKATAGGGPFMDIGVHMADIALHLLGEPSITTVTASAYAEFGPRGMGSWTPNVGPAAEYDVEDLATTFCRLGTGATLILEASWAQWVAHDLSFVDLYGTEAGAHLEWGSPATGDAGRLVVMTEVKGHPAEITPEIRPSGGHDACIDDFVRLVRADGSTSAHGELLVRRAELIDAAYTSAADQREVVLG